MADTSHVPAGVHRPTDPLPTDSAKTSGWPSTVGVVLRCHQHSAFVARVVGLVRPFVDEVVVAADEQMTAEALGTIAAAGPTRLVRIPHVFPNERATAYIHDLCSTGWVLRLAGDEVPSLALLRSLRCLVADSRLTHYRLPVAWLWPDVRSVLDEPPWWPDSHIRLFRNDAAVVNYSGVTHAGLEIAGHYRHLDLPLYHLVFLLGDTAARRAKAARYEQERPGLRCLGQPFNETWYLPELREPPPRTCPVVEEDRTCLAEVLGSSLDGCGAPVDLPVARVADVDAHWASHPWTEASYEARLTFADHNVAFDSAGTRMLFVRAKNLGDRTWPSALASAPLIRLSYHWHASDGTLSVWEGVRTGFSSPVAPGEELLVPMEIESPGAGKWILELDLVHEAVRWFNRSVRVLVDIQ